jgi:ATP-dependent RNA helicase DeaD
MDTQSTSETKGFADFSLPVPILETLEEQGYEHPTAIQERAIPPLLEGRDVLGQAQTGTGKTAAFALPLLTRIDMSRKEPQVLVLAPTRELAIQVSKSFKTYAKKLRGFKVQAIYGGQDYQPQLRGLKQGPQVIVGTPGRVMDHMRRGTLDLSTIQALVLDEADEMLHMGFLEDMHWILERAPENRQMALFSATMPEQIRRVASKYLNKPEEVLMKVRSTVAETITQTVWMGNWRHKLETVLRLLEGESYESVILFVRTKVAAVELADELKVRGHSCAFLNGDLPQRQREQIIERLKAGHIDLLVATDVAARGLDVKRISHVINYDAPRNVEGYIHRIGRTGRAGRAGKAVLFLSHRESYLLRDIERATKQKVKRLELPSIDLINEKRITEFKDRITKALESKELDFYSELLEKFQEEKDISPLKLAAALASLVQGKEPLLLSERKIRQGSNKDWQAPQAQGRQGRSKKNDERKSAKPDKGMERFRIAVGRSHGVRPGNIVGAIANEAGLDSQFIGRINIFNDYSTVDLPEGMPKNIFNTLKTVWVSGQQLRISKFLRGAGGNSHSGGDKKRKSPHKKHKISRPRKTVKSAVTT